MEIDPSQIDPRVMVRNFAMEEPMSVPVAIQLPRSPPPEAVPMSAPPPPPSFGGEQQAVSGRGSRTEKPYGFALRNGTTGARIYFGSLLASVTKIKFVRRDLIGTADAPFNVLEEEVAIPKLVQYIPTNLDTDFGYKNATELSWFGDVFLYWEIDDQGDIVADTVEIKGPGEPDGFDVPKLKKDLSRDWGVANPKRGKYFIKIGNVDGTTREVTQLISGDVHWHICFLLENNQARTDGYSGTRNFYDCDENLIFSITWVNGIVTSEDTISMSAGCGGGSSSSSSSFDLMADANFQQIRAIALLGL